MSLVKREDFIGFLEVETRRGGRRYIAILPDGSVEHYFELYGKYNWVPLGYKSTAGEDVKPVKYFTKRGARNAAWKEYWRTNYKNDVRIVGR